MFYQNREHGAANEPSLELQFHKSDGITFVM